MPPGLLPPIIALALATNPSYACAKKCMRKEEQEKSKERRKEGRSDGEGEKFGEEKCKVERMC